MVTVMVLLRHGELIIVVMTLMVVIVLKRNAKMMVKLPIQAELKNVKTACMILHLMEPSVVILHGIYMVLTVQH